MSLVNQNQLARALGVSHTAVAKAVKSGRITVAKRDDKDRALFDPDAAMQQWAANANPSKKRAHKSGGRPRSDGTPNQARADLPESPLADRLLPPVGGDALNASPDEGEPINYNRANALEKHYKAQLARLEYEQKIGTLVPIVNVAEEVEREYTRVRARLLAIPSKLAPDVALTDDVAACRALIEAAIVDALNELAADAAATEAANDDA